MNIVLTGASRGIGYETALALCNYKIDNLIVISRNKKALIKLKQECESLNKEVNISIWAQDILKIVNDGNGIYEKIGFDKCDVLINNAGYLVRKSFEDMASADVQRLFDINTIAPVGLIQLLIPLMRKSKSAHVVNIGSMAGFQGSSKFPGLSYYSASKAALSSITECLAEEYKDSNIHFNCLALGAVQTEMLNEAFPGFKATLNAKDMGEYIAGFALKGQKYYNGKILPITISTP